MKNTDRRNFLKLSSLAGIGLVSQGVQAADQQGKNTSGSYSPSPTTAAFNMCGFSAPKLDKVRVGIIGLGNRGPGAVRRLSFIEGVEIKALCDLRPQQVDKALKILESTSHKPETYSGKTFAWKALCDRPDIDLIYIATPWEWHTPMAVYAMEAGKHVATEVPAAKTLEECWQLVETSERTRKHCMMLENCCYDFFELLTLNMARQGFFGEIVHAEGAYIHTLIDSNFSKDGYQAMWRLKENIDRNGNLYPTHGLGPICQIMNINRGDQMDYLTSLSTNDFSMGARARELAETDDFYEPYVNDAFRGNMNTTLVKTKKGRSIMIQHDVSSPRPYSRIHIVSGTKGVAQKWPMPGKIANTHEDWLSEAEMKELEAKYTPEIVLKVGELAKKVGGHGGMDFIMDWRLIDCLRNGLPLDQDVYDAALWSAIAPLSEQSVAKRAQSVDVPDFTRGNWVDNKPVELTLANAGTTNVRIRE